jgi:hypothetical protein
MTVKQLIEILSQIEDQEVLVMTKGYEGGVDDIGTSFSTIVNVALEVNGEWYYGSHEVVSESTTYKDKTIVKAIVIR